MRNFDIKPKMLFITLPLCGEKIIYIGIKHFCFSPRELEMSNIHKKYLVTFYSILFGNSVMKLILVCFHIRKKSYLV